MEAATTCSAAKLYMALQMIGCLDLTAHMCPRDTIIQDVNSIRCDYIIVGAGASGSVVANRLTENLQNRVCLIEAGGDPPLDTALPGLNLYGGNSRPLSSWDYKYEVDPQNPTFHRDGITTLPLVKMLGGSSQLDYVYERGNPEDYDAWAKVANDNSWSYDNVLRTFKKSERLHDTIINRSEYRKYHGTNGPLGVTKQYCERINEYLDAVTEIGHKELIDFSGRNVMGYGRPYLTVADKLHQTAAYSFLSPVKDRVNLKVIKNSIVVRLTLDKNNANGVCFVQNGNNEEICLRAIKEVVLSAGAINTATLLMRSGIGPKDHLKEHNIKCLSDLPVGRKLSVQGVIPILHQTKVNTLAYFPESMDPYTYPAPLLHGRIATNAKYPQYKSLNHILTSTMLLSYCRNVYGYTDEICSNFYDQAKNKEIMFTEITAYDTKSTGYVALRSQSYKDAPIIKHGLMRESSDIERVLQYIKDFRGIYKSSFFKSVNASELKVTQCQAYEWGSDDYFKCYIKGMVSSNGNHLGTCAMGSVVDSNLRVYGIGNLRIADSSVSPVPISASLYITNIMIGERAAEIIIEYDKLRELNFNGNSKENLDSDNSGDSSGSDSDEDSKDSSESGSDEDSGSKESKEKKKDKKKPKKGKENSREKSNSKESHESGSSESHESGSSESHESGSSKSNESGSKED